MRATLQIIAEKTEGAIECEEKKNDQGVIAAGDNRSPQS